MQKQIYLIKADDSSESEHSGSDSKVLWSDSREFYFGLSNETLAECIDVRSLSMDKLDRKQNQSMQI